MQATTQYYTLDSQRIALRQGSTLYYLLSDHLGSTSVTLDAAGNAVSTLRYYPWGTSCYTSGTTPTQRRFTGQTLDSNTGLYFYNARYYDPAIGRFIQTDTIVPTLLIPRA